MATRALNLVHVSRTLLCNSPGVSTGLSTRALLCEGHRLLQAKHFSGSPISQKAAVPGPEKVVPPVHDAAPSQNIDDVIKSRLEDVKSGQYKDMDHPEDLKHFKTRSTSAGGSQLVAGEGDAMRGYNLPHPIWTEEELHNVVITHKQPVGAVDWMAMYSVKGLRGMYDIISGYKRRTRDEKLWLNRIIFLETVAGVPGMVAAMVRHLHSLRKMRRDHGWIHTLLEEAENERMHLMTALQLKQPTLAFRTMVMGAQGTFVTMFSFAYLVAPTYCHRFVGYLEEEAVVTYTKCLKDIEDGHLKHWQTQDAPVLAKNYWHLRPDATMRDVILAIRADEAHHRVVNHTLASMDRNDFNPYKPGE